MRFHAYLNTAKTLLQNYNGSEPLNYYLKNYFSSHKKHGSKDRKFISELCYCYCRIGKALPQLTIEEKIKTALFLCNTQVNNWQDLFENNWLDNWHKELSKRIEFIKSEFENFNVEDIFPFKNEVSESIDFTAFAKAHLIQPNLFLRVRPHYTNSVIEKLKKAELNFKILHDTCIALPNASKINELLNINKEVVIQDYSSQQISKYFTLIQSLEKNSNSSVFTIWDCCAASGGKSILAKDILGNIQLTVSDIRKNILHNLQKRFNEADIKNYHSFVADIASKNWKPFQAKFKIVICDVPCSGSGTWSRTPEQILFFSTEKIKEYATLQKNIVSNVVSQIENGGYFLYITCSVFKAENEGVVSFIQEKHSLQLIQFEVLKGYDKEADSMFVALFKK
ncbi:MAG: Fmu (Sun) domain-containing protein [Chitinophagales bacterium]|nr:Fmu (Sun) domain-containing protein [Chitinophagales bacterium]